MYTIAVEGMDAVGYNFMLWEVVTIKCFKSLCEVNAFCLKTFKQNTEYIQKNLVPCSQGPPPHPPELK